MPTSLDRAITSLSDHQTPLSDALRGLLTVARRMMAEDLTAWVRAELSGYDSGSDPPPYRVLQSLPLKLRFDGPLNSRDVLRVHLSDLPADLRPADDAGMQLLQPLAELLQLSRGETDPTLQQPGWWIEMYRERAGRGEVPHPQGMVLNEAHAVLPRTMLVGLIDQVRTTALELALDVEAVAPTAGEASGPTIETDAELNRTIATAVTNIYANNSTVVVGDRNTTVDLSANLEAGDIEGMIKVIERVLGPSPARDLSTAISEDANEPREATRGILERIRSGSYNFVSGISTNAAYDGILALLHQVFPNFN